ncbi:hypothetical protein [Paraburkholderia sp. JHI869]|uniref:hypothetical protein n=1 Tax=Paraburkholderia sp. JHI869 TaxID=3112959 RepID=UPI00316CCB84
MSALDEFAERFGRPQSNWTREQWKQVAIELASRLDSTNRAPAKRGRPRHDDDAAFVRGKSDNVTVTAKANYAALAWQVEQRMDQADADRRPLTMKEAVREELVEAIRRHNGAEVDRRGKRSGEIRESRADDMVKTAYTEVRKLLKKWREEPESASAGDQKDSQDMNIREAIDNYSHPAKENDKNPRPDWAKDKPVNLRMRKRH